MATAGPVYHPVDPVTITKVGKDVNGGTLKGGDVIEWTITVTNIGLTPTTHVVIHDTRAEHHPLREGHASAAKAPTSPGSRA